MNGGGISLAKGRFLALLAAPTMRTPVAASAQSVAPGEPSARAPIAIAENSGEVKPNPDKLAPSAEAAPLTPPAPAVTVVPPASNPVPAATAATPEPTATVATPTQPDQQAAPMPAYTGKDLVKAPIATSLSTADAAIAEKLRDLLANKSSRHLARKNERD